MGISEWLICDSFYLAEKGYRIVYVQPTIELRNLFVRDRIDRPLSTIPHYRNQVRPLKKMKGVDPIDNVGLKSFGENGIIVFVGSNSKNSFVMFTADVMIIDERDKCNEENLALAPDRISASKLAYWREVSTPTVEGFGIDRTYNTDSDQKVWQIRCTACKHWQPLSFFRNMVRQVDDNKFELIDQTWDRNLSRDIHTFCVKCHSPIDRLSLGEWIPRLEGRSISGYHVSKLMSANFQMSTLWSKFQTALTDQTKLQVFYNSDLGEAFSAKGSKLTRSILDLCIEAGERYNMPSSGKRSVLGVDVGKLLHVVIMDNPEGKIKRPLYIGTVRNFEELDFLIKQFDVMIGVVDARPETREANKFAERVKAQLNRAVWLCEYPTSDKIEDLNYNAEEGIVKVDRTQTLDELVSEFLLKNIILPANAASLDTGEVFAQLCAPTRIYDEKAKRFRWEEKGQPDHYCHAFNYCNIGFQLMGKLPKPNIRII